MANGTRDALIAHGVRNLRQFGYPEVTAENILTDAVYGAFFESILRDNLGRSDGADVEITALLSQIKESRNATP